MPDPTTELAVQQEVLGSRALIQKRTDLPSHFADDAREINSVLDGFIRPPRIKLVQGTSKPPLSTMYQPGDAVLMPAMDLLAAQGNTFSVVPLFMYAEYLYTNPMGVDPFIIDRSYSPTSLIAAKARDPKRRFEDNPNFPGVEKKRLRYRSNLIFICALVNRAEMAGLQVALTFSSSEYKNGEAWSTRLKTGDIPMCGTVWDVKVTQRTNADGAWYGLDIIRPDILEDQRVNDPELYKLFKQQHIDYKLGHSNNLIRVDTDADDMEGTSVAGSTEF